MQYDTTIVRSSHYLYYYRKREVEIMAGQRFAGQTLIMVGGSGGLGEAAVERAFEDGARVAILDRQQGSFDAIPNATDPARLFQAECDVTNPESVQSAIAQVLSWSNKIDAMVYMVGAIQGQPLDEVVIEDWHRIHDINNTGFMLCAQAILPHFLEHQHGSFVTVSSVSANVAGIGKCLAYKSAKAALIQLTRSIAVDYATQGIRANCILPGPIATGFGRGGRIASSDELATPSGVMPPMGRRADPREIANAVLFLASNDSSYISGVELPVDGGFLAI